MSVISIDVYTVGGALAGTGTRLTGTVKVISIAVADLTALECTISIIVSGSVTLVCGVGVIVAGRA